MSKYSQLLKRSALTNYCIDLLATKLFGTSPEKLSSATYPIYHQTTSTVSCQITLNSLHSLICIGRDTCCLKTFCGSQLSNTLGPRLDCRFIWLYFFVFRSPKLKESRIKPKFSRQRVQVQDSRTKIQEPKSRVKEANEPKYCQPTLKGGQVTHQSV